MKNDIILTDFHLITNTQQNLCFMNQYVSELRKEVEEFRQVSNFKEVSSLSHLKDGIRLMENVFVRLKTFVLNYEFKNKEEEINFFKKSKPKLYSQLIFYREAYNIEVNRPQGGSTALQDYLRKELERIEGYYWKNKEFYHYYRSGNIYMDEIFFLRSSKPEIHLHLESFHLERDALFCTNCDYKVANILANDMLESYLMLELDKLENKDNEYAAPAFPKEKLTWTGSKADLIELIYALMETKVFNHGKASLKEVVCYFENVFNIELGTNPSRTFIELCIRKIQTAFIDKLQNLLTNRMEKENKKKDKK